MPIENSVDDRALAHLDRTGWANTVKRACTLAGGFEGGFVSLEQAPEKYFSSQAGRRRQRLSDRNHTRNG